MYKIKSLILLQISFLFLSCTTNNIKENNLKFSLGYIAGEYDGLVLSDLLHIHLKSNKLLDEQSNYELKANISHATEVYITNIDNTSNRERITSTIDIVILDKKNKCHAFSFNKEIINFYVFASSEKFISNQKATQRIKFENTETLVKKFINKLNYAEMEICHKSEKKGKM